MEAEVKADLKGSLTMLFLRNIPKNKIKRRENLEIGDN